MATSPAPDAAAPPGMCPGIAVLGGGGAGGDGDGSGNGGGDGSGGDGKGDGKGGNGGGKGAGACGPGSGGGCPNPKHGGKGGTQAGHPIDPVTGRVYTIAVPDMVLPGAFPLIIERAYSSAQCDLDYGLGHGWNHSLGWRILELRHDVVRIVTETSLACEGPRPEVGATVKLPVGRLTRTSTGYWLLPEDGITRIFDGSDALDNVFRLSALVDRNGNRANLFYQDGTGLLQLVNDSVGRLLRLRRHRDGRIAAFEVKNASVGGAWTSFRTYEYDGRGDLVGARDALGHTTAFAYDDEHHLVLERWPTGLEVHYRYDRQGRCVETWCTDPNEHRLLADDVPKVLADGSRAKGFLHAKVEYGQGENNVLTSRALRRVQGNKFGKADRIVWAGRAHDNEFDAAGELIGYRDGLGRSWKMGESGGAYRVTNPLGEVTEYGYNRRGDVVTTRASDGSETLHERDRSGNLLGFSDSMGLVASFRYDEQGCLVHGETADGGQTTMKYDVLCNRVEIVEPDGATRKLRYDFLGRLVEMIDTKGGSHRWIYDAMGRVVEYVSPLDAHTFTSYDEVGRFNARRDADGRWFRLIYSGIQEVIAVERSDGTHVAYAYDRELDMVRIVNEEGDIHTIVRDLEGRICSERTFDGRTLRYKNDEAGRMSRITFEDGQFVDLAYDDLDRLVERSFSDDTFHKLAYDAHGHIVLAETELVRTQYTYNSRGSCVREDTELVGDPSSATSLLHAFGPGLRRREVTVPGGWSIAIERDAAGRCSALTLSDARGAAQPLAAFAYDPAGAETARYFPGGVGVQQTRDAHGNVVRASVVGAVHAGARPGQPMWVGEQASAETIHLDYQWSPAGELEVLSDRDQGAQSFTYDARGRIAQKRHEKRARTEDYVLSPRGDVRSIDGRAQSHVNGGRLVTAAGATLSYDLRGRLVKKVEGTEETTYEWSVLGLLTGLTLPDRTRLEFAYDGFARRLEKRVIRFNAVERHRYRWDGDDLIEETVERRATDVAAETPFTLVERRRYAYSPHSETPIAQAIDTESGAGAWRYFVHREGAPIPLALVRADGTVEAAFETEAYGRVIAGDAAATRSRFAGHWYDQETGLHYNRWRYFDPATGTYLSPEPLGLLGGLESYGYASGRPLALVDRDGLTCDTTITGANGEVLATGRSSGATRPEDLHPAVAAALPVANARNGANPIATTSCSEPVALSNYLNDWQRTTGQTCDPGTPQGRRELNGALSQMKGISSNVGATPMAACPNCSQTISRLGQLADPPVPMPTVGAGQATGSTTIVPGGLQNPQGAAQVPSRKGGMVDMAASPLVTNTDPATAANPAAMAAANQDAYARAGGTGSVAGLTPGVFNNSSGAWGRVL